MPLAAWPRLTTCWSPAWRPGPQGEGRGLRGPERPPTGSSRRARPLVVAAAHSSPLSYFPVASVSRAVPSSPWPRRNGPREPCPFVSAGNRLPGASRLTTDIRQGSDGGRHFRRHPPAVSGGFSEKRRLSPGRLQSQRGDTPFRVESGWPGPAPPSPTPATRGLRAESAAQAFAMCFVWYANLIS